MSTAGGTKKQFREPCEALVDHFKDLEDGETRGKELHTGVLKPIGDRDSRLTKQALKGVTALVRHGELEGVPVDGLVEAVKAKRACWGGKMRDVCRRIDIWCDRMWLIRF